MAQDELLKDIRRRMDGAIEVLHKEFGGLRTGRASASLLEPVQVLGEWAIRNSGRVEKAQHKFDKAHQGAPGR